MLKRVTSTYKLKVEYVVEVEEDENAEDNAAGYADSVMDKLINDSHEVTEILTDILELDEFKSTYWEWKLTDQDIENEA